ALAKQLKRIGASLAAGYSPGGRPIASTPEKLAPRSFDGPVRSRSSDDAQGSATFYAVLSGRPMQIVLIPLRAPEPIAWVAFGFVLDQVQERSLGALVHAQVRFVSSQANSGSDADAGGAVQLVHQDGQDFLALAQPLPVRAGAITLLVRQPLAEAMAP